MECTSDFDVDKRYMFWYEMYGNFWYGVFTLVITCKHAYLVYFKTIWIYRPFVQCFFRGHLWFKCWSTWHVNRRFFSRMSKIFYVTVNQFIDCWWFYFSYHMEACMLCCTLTQVPSICTLSVFRDLIPFICWEFRLIRWHEN